MSSHENLRAKYCHGVKVFPLSTERSSTQRSGRGELANLMRTYATWKSLKPEDKGASKTKRGHSFRTDFGVML